MNVGYARVSKHEQYPDLKRRALEVAGCERIFEDCSFVVGRLLDQGGTVRSAPSRSSMEATHCARSAAPSRRNLSRMTARSLFAAVRSFGRSAASAALSKASVASTSLPRLISVLPRPRNA